MPFVFVYHPTLILDGSTGDIVLAVGTAVIGVFFLSVGCAGYLFRALGWGKRALMGAAGLLLIPPPLTGIWLVANTLGFLFGLLMVAWERNGTAFARAAAAHPDRAPKSV